jgi:tetratricopeptide (TPR) repeat protein/TolB-like protein
MRVVGLCLSIILAASNASAQRKTIAVAPLVTSGPAEHQWIGTALAAALVTRVAVLNELNTITLRQLESAMEEDNMEPGMAAQAPVVRKLGRLLGADYIATGTVDAKPPQVEITLSVYEPFESKEPVTHKLTGKIEKLIDLEAKLAEAFAGAIGKKLDTKPGHFGTKSLPAWRATVLAQIVLDAQGLSPKWADLSMPLQLKKPAIEAALADAKKGVELDPKFGEAWSTQGVALALLKQYKEATACFEKAVGSGYGTFPTALAGLAFVRMREGQFDEAARLLADAVVKRPGLLLMRGYLGEMYSLLGNHQMAMAVFDAYASAAPRQPWVLAQRGYAKTKSGDKKGAVADSEAAVKMVPESVALNVQLASRYIDVGDLASAEAALHKVEPIFPTETRIYVRLGYIYLLQGKDDLAIAASEKAVSLSKSRWGERDRLYAHLNLARAYGHKGELDKSLQNLDQAVAAGLWTLQEVEKDPKLAAVRADPRYKQLTP